MINAETSELESMGLQFPEGKVNISISRSMFDGKMASILSGAGGAKCQLCTATNEQIKDLTLIRSGFSINRCIEDAKQIFIDVNIEEFLKLSSEHRFGLTHLPASEKDITPVSPLHSYLCVFRWLIIFIYHLDARIKKWNPTGSSVKTSMFRLQSLLIEKTGFQIDIPSCDGGTSTTRNVARRCFLDERDFITWATSTILPEDKPGVIYIHKHLSIILRVYGLVNKSIPINSIHCVRTCMNISLQSFLGLITHLQSIKYLHIQPKSSPTSITDMD